MVNITRKFYGLLATLLTCSYVLLAQADQESPFQVNETVTKGDEGLGSTIWIVVGVVILLGIFLLLKKGGSGATRAGNPK